MVYIRRAQGSAERECPLSRHGARPLRQHKNTTLSVTWRALRHRVCQGARIFEDSAPFARAYIVESGEVLIICGGQPVDLIEAGELLDSRFWHDATAVAHTDCILASPRMGV